MPDSAQPTFITVDAQGRIRYDFDGRISARGVDLLAGVTGSPPDDRKVRWLRESDGALVAELYAFDTGPARGAGLRVNDPAAPARQSYVQPLVFPGGVNFASVEVGADSTSSNHLRRLLGSDGRSHYLQVDAANGPDPKRSKVGNVTITWPGAQAWATSPAIVHNWNTGPVRLLGAAAREYFGSAPPTGPLAVGAIGNGLNQLTLIATIGQGFAVPPAGTQQVIDYLICEA